MSTAPCGHSEANCVFGNYWECSVCESPKVTSVLEMNSVEDVKKIMSDIPLFPVRPMISAKDLIEVQPMKAPASSFFLDYRYGEFRSKGDGELFPKPEKIPDEKKLQSDSWTAAYAYLSSDNRDPWDDFRTTTEAMEKAKERFLLTGSCDPSPDNPPVPFVPSEVKLKHPENIPIHQEGCGICEAMRAAPEAKSAETINLNLNGNEIQWKIETDPSLPENIIQVKKPLDRDALAMKLQGLVSFQWIMKNVFELSDKDVEEAKYFQEKLYKGYQGLPKCENCKCITKRDEEYKLCYSCENTF